MVQYAKIVINELHRTHLVDATGGVKLKANLAESPYSFIHRACLYGIDQGMSIDRFYGDHEDYPETKEGWIRTDATVYQRDKADNLFPMFHGRKVVYASPADPYLSTHISKIRDEGWECCSHGGKSIFLDTEEEARETMFTFMKQERLRFLL